MAQQIMGALFQEGTSQTRPPYFNGKHFSHWKVRMEKFIQSYDVKVLRVIKLGDISIPTSKNSDDGQSSTTPSLENYTNEQMEVIQINSKAKKMYYTKLLVVNDMKRYNVVKLLRKCGTNWKLPMKEGETIESMFAQLSKIIGELKASGKTYPQIEHIRRVLRSLPSQWNAKVVALECMNLNTITYEEVKKTPRRKLWLSKPNQEDKGEEKRGEDEIALITGSVMELFGKSRNNRRGRNSG
ncbi:hypothetical protein KY285_005200 [Solanum tuberosum]|nr:hypothetical protein KY284_024844 [Solanum tuberosum]KAH0677079.1 hypothetical protein KY285_024880 [Solanum tuberosum]KAH0752052.1 hypothetical protein KY285_005200 [Solanum tuberosum]